MCVCVVYVCGFWCVCLRVLDEWRGWWERVGICRCVSKQMAKEVVNVGEDMRGRDCFRPVVAILCSGLHYDVHIVLCDNKTRTFWGGEGRPMCVGAIAHTGVCFVCVRVCVCLCLCLCVCVCVCVCACE